MRHLDRREYAMDKDAIIRRALRFPIEPVLKLYMKWFGVSEEEAHEHELELKRYLALSALNKEKQYKIGEAPIANLWRTFIVFTTLYTEFCMVVAGVYLHYTPADAETTLESQNAHSYQELLRDYEAVYKSEAPEHLWPRIADQEGAAVLDADLAYNTR
jgi:hypothetical protein